MVLFHEMVLMRCIWFIRQLRTAPSKAGSWSGVPQVTTEPLVRLPPAGQ